MRKSKKLTQDGLASAIGINESTVGRYESGEISPTLDSLLSLASALNTSVSELIGESSDLNQLSPTAKDCATLISTWDDVDQFKTLHCLKAINLVSDITTDIVHNVSYYHKRRVKNLS